MNHETISQYENLRQESGELFPRFLEAIAHAVPAEYVETVKNIGKEFLDRYAAIPQEMEAMEADIKAHVMATGEHVVGRYLQAYPVSGRTGWDGKKLQALALTYPEIATCKKTGESYAVIRALAIRTTRKPVLFDVHMG